MSKKSAAQPSLSLLQRAMTEKGKKFPNVITTERLQKAFELIGNLRIYHHPMAENIRLKMNAYHAHMRFSFEQASINWVHILKFEELLTEKKVKQDALKMWQSWMDSEGYTPQDKKFYADLIKQYVAFHIEVGAPKAFFVNFL